MGVKLGVGVNGCSFQFLPSSQAIIFRRAEAANKYIIFNQNTTLEGGARQYFLFFERYGKIRLQ